MTANSPQPTAFEIPQRRHMRTSAISNQAASRYQVTLVASSVKDIVESAGGWLFDRITEGWVVNCLQIDDLGSNPDALLPLQILGYRAPASDVGDLLPMRNRAPIQTLAIGGDVVQNDAQARTRVKGAVKRGTPACQGELSPLVHSKSA